MRTRHTDPSAALDNVADAMATFAVKFLGCKVSQADAMLARQALLAAGHAEVPRTRPSCT